MFERDKIVGLVVFLLLAGFMYHMYQNTRINHYKEESIKWERKYIETMANWSRCLANKATETHKHTMCSDSLYDLRQWLRWCKPICRTKKRKFNPRKKNLRI